MNKALRPAVIAGNWKMNNTRPQTRELLEAQGDLAQAYRQFDQALDPELVESCVYQISAVKARCNYLIRAIKERSPEAAAAAGLEGASTWT